MADKAQVKVCLVVIDGWGLSEEKKGKMKDPSETSVSRQPSLLHLQ
jgi:bisphosphoglycerate-independent phosphoglycerate mutase (AlkP superfamily)